MSGCATQISPCINVNGVGLDEQEDILVNVFPNPSTGIFTITHTAQTDRLKLVIFNSLGQLVFEIDDVSAQEVLDLTSLASGAYYGKLMHNEMQISILKLIKY